MNKEERNLYLKALEVLDMHREDSDSVEPLVIDQAVNVVANLAGEYNKFQSTLLKRITSERDILIDKNRALVDSAMLNKALEIDVESVTYPCITKCLRIGMQGSVKLRNHSDQISIVVKTILIGKVIVLVIENSGKFTIGDELVIPL